MFVFEFKSFFKIKIFDYEVVNFLERNDPDSGLTAFDQGSGITLSNGKVGYA